MNNVPTSQRCPRPAGPREIGNAAGVVAVVGVFLRRIKTVGVGVFWGRAVEVTVGVGG
jgi:hypothetical protein